jgi:hypothetical protein
MKIAINRDIVETEDIYNITKVVGDGCWLDYQDEEVYIKNKNLTHGGYEFFVELYTDHRSIKVSIDGNKMFGSDWWRKYQKDYSGYLSKLEIMKNKAERFRQELIKIWQDTVLDIPKFEIDNFEKSDNENFFI